VKSRLDENSTTYPYTLRGVSFVMKDGIVFKKEGVMIPEKFFHSGPTPPSAWRIH